MKASWAMSSASAGLRVAHDQLDEFVLVLKHQRIKRPLVPALYAPDQTQITSIGAHARLHCLKEGRRAVSWVDCKLE